MINFQEVIIKLLVVAIWFANADSKGYPWDWQSGNAKFPVYNGYPANHHQSLHKQHLQQHRPRYPTVRILNMNTNVSAVAGDTAHLPCRVKDLGEYTVSWLRGRDTSVLSVGHVTFSSDQRFQVIEGTNAHISSSDWNLEIKQIGLKDEGWYDCQVNTEPKLSSKSFLKVFDKRAVFDGGKSWRGVRQQSIQSQESSTSPSSIYLSSIHQQPLSTKSYHHLQDSPLRPRGVVPQIQEFLQPRGGIKTKIEGPAVLRLPPGGTLSLQCTISRLNLPPKNLHWKHESTILTSRTRPGVSLESEKLSGESNTKLVIVDLKSSDEGTYQCVTDASRPATVRLFIDSDGAEALASRVSSSTTPTAKLILLLLVPFSLGSIFSHTTINQ